MGIPVNECTYIYGDNQSVLCNTTTPHSQLKKKSNSVAYHHVREGSALDEWRTTYVCTEDNASDLLTKAIPPGEKRTKFCKMLLHFLNPGVDYGNDDKKIEHAAAAAIDASKEEWITVIIAALEYELDRGTPM